jgi:hypothetical protein
MGHDGRFNRGSSCMLSRSPGFFPVSSLGLFRGCRTRSIGGQKVADLVAPLSKVQTASPMDNGASS